jgi:hypothetical protein
MEDSPQDNPLPHPAQILLEAPWPVHSSHVPLYSIWEGAKALLL